MTVHVITDTDELSSYDQWLRSHPHASLWQSLEWKMYREALGNEVRIYVAEDGGDIVASALVVIDRTTFGFSTWEIPRGPLLKVESGVVESGKCLMGRIIDDAKNNRCISLYSSPPLSTFHFPLSTSSRRHIHPTATRIVDLTKSKEEILAQMKPKGRYNIRVAEKSGVRVELSNDIDAYFELTKETSKRDRFTGLPKEHYRTFLKDLRGSLLLLAYNGNRNRINDPIPNSMPIAGLLGVINNNRGTYYYGASSYAHRASMAPYALQWEAMQICKQVGCTEYDLLGIAPPDANTNHPWQGITGFKEKFGGELVTFPEEMQVVMRPVAMKLLEWKRFIWR